MGKLVAPRTVQCYHCRHRFEVGGRTQSTACPKCHKPLHVSDIVVDKLWGPGRELRTCGRVQIHKKARIIAEFIEAHDGIDCQGVLECKRVLSGDTVTIGKGAQWKGNLTAPKLHIEQGARIMGGVFAVPDDPMGLTDLPRKPR